MPTKTPVLSIIVCAFNMQRELPRTLLTLSPRMQIGVSATDYEIIVLDNGSVPEVRMGELTQIASNIRLVRIDNAQASPVQAINQQMQILTSNCIGLWIDGARMASPGVISLALDAFRRDPSKIIGTLSFHLGTDVQMNSVFAGYNQDAEDKLLSGTNWSSDSYSLFDISVLAGSSREGWFGCIGESNGVFFGREFFQKTGGLDERFRGVGGGFANLEFWNRAVQYSGFQPWILLGEGTFHQVHGGAATNSNAAVRKAMHEEFIDIFQRPFEVLRYSPQYIGALNEKTFRCGMPK
ncbi:MAG: glycosyltransferase [Phyllobacteriaceae bacterium]|nr:glycosyltransferase [Phyllobacteriaceae bacterium]